MTPRQVLGALCAATATLLLAVTPLHAQELGLNGVAEANVSFFFGNTREWLVAGRSQLAYADSAVELHGEVRASYAESATDSGNTTVSARSWFGSLGVDLSPFATLSPFVLGSVETSLQARIARRYTGGFGGKLSFVRSTKNELSTSFALLWEQTRALDGEPTDDLTTSRLRWSARLQVKRQLDERLRLTHVTFYQPSVREPEQFTVSSTSTLSLDLTKTLALVTTLQDNYDSEARKRGARSNNDGQLLLGLRARY